MRDAEQVTFGGSGLDRAARLRGDAVGLAALSRRPDARTLAIWRGKVLARGADLAWLRPDHPVFSEAPPPVFLGLDGEAPRFARDIGAWDPPPGAAAPAGGFLDTTEQAHPLVGPGAAFAELRSLMAGLSPREAECAATARALTGWHRSHGFCAACGAPTDVAMAGWQRQCAACGTHHFPRTDPVVIMLILSGNSVLLGRSPGWPEGMYSLLAGFMEPGETVEAAVRREVAEETGVPVGRVSYLASQPWPFPASLMIGARGEALDRRIVPDETEIEDALWLSREDVAAAFRGAHPRLRPPRRGAIAGFLLAAWLADRLD